MQLKEYLEEIRKKAAEIGREVKIMEVCGGHTNIIMKYGLRDAMPENVKLVSGPGCPVCVTSRHDIDSMIELANRGIPVATYGDMMRVPGSRSSLEEAKARYGNVFEVYSAEDVLQMKNKYKEIVFFGIGFETTSPMTAYLLKKGVCVYSVHKLIIPAMMQLVKGRNKIDGFIDPGHVSAIIGTGLYGCVKAPQVVTGFQIDLMLKSIDILLDLIRRSKDDVVNAYESIVRPQGNVEAQRLIRAHMYIADSPWRGLGVIKDSGLEVRNDKLNAKVKYREILKEVPAPVKNQCRCGDVLKGMISPEECPLYKVACTPKNPAGACMVSGEGACAISYKYSAE